MPEVANLIASLKFFFLCKKLELLLTIATMSGPYKVKESLDSLKYLWNRSSDSSMNKILHWRVSSKITAKRFFMLFSIGCQHAIGVQ